MATTETFPELPLFDLRLEPQDLEAVAETLRSGWLTLGPSTAAFEEAFAAQLGARHAVAVSSCTAALHLAYLAAGVGPGRRGDRALVHLRGDRRRRRIYCGATPVFAEIVSRKHPSLDPEDVERRITPRTKAVCAVHYAGYAAAVDRLKALCEKHGIALIEDVAHAPSATLDGRKLGTWGLAGAFSFFSNKVLSVGEGGLLCTDDDEVAAFVRSRRSHAMTSGTWDRHSGRTDTYDVVGLGFNYRLDEPRSALLLSRLERLEAEIERRRELTVRYRCLLDAGRGDRRAVRGRRRPGLLLLRDPRHDREDGTPGGDHQPHARARHPDEHLLPLDPPLHAPIASASPASRCRSPSSRREPS